MTVYLLMSYCQSYFIGDRGLPVRRYVAVVRMFIVLPALPRVVFSMSNERDTSIWERWRFGVEWHECEMLKVLPSTL